MRDKFGDIIRLQHIVDAIEEISQYTLSSDFDSFSKHSMMKFAVVKQLEVIGETANHLSEEIIFRTSEVDWIKIIATRNIFVHEYFGIDDKLLWDIVQNDLLPLKNQITKILSQLNGQE